MEAKHEKLLRYFKELHKHVGRIDYNDICIDIDSFNCSFPSIVQDVKEIPRYIESHLRRDRTIIFRARENETKKIETEEFKLPFKTLGEISIIPDCKKHLVKFGRCNKPGEPRFYASNDIRTACIESLTSGFSKDIHESKWVTVGRWQIIEPLIVAQVNFSIESLNKFFQSDPERYKVMLDFAALFNSHAINQISEMDQNIDLEFAEQILGLFEDEFAKIDIEEGHDYTISNYYCDSIFDRTPVLGSDEKIDGILYPSVSFAYQETNLVLHPRALKKIKFLDASLIWAARNPKSGNVEFNAVESNVKVDEKGNLRWIKHKW